MRIVKSVLLQLIALFVFLFLLYAPWENVFAQEKTIRTSIEYKVKAAFLYNFLKFVKWPDESMPDGGAHSDKLSLCILGENRFGSALDPLKEKSLKNKLIEVRNIKLSSDSYTDCNVLFIDRGQKKKLKDIFSSIDDKPVLTVSDIRKFSEMGGGIGFAMEKGKVRFDINTKTVSKRGLKISSKILELAREVY